MNRRIHFVVPGSLEQRTGGYLYDAHMVAGLRERGWSVTVHGLDGTFPIADEVSRRSLASALESISDGATVVLDGLAMGGLPDPLSHHRDRLRLVGLVHHPLADETGLTGREQARLEKLERVALSAVDGVVTTSLFTLRRLEEFGVPVDRMRSVIPGIESPASWPGMRGVEPTSAPLPQEPVLLCVGTMIPRKGQDVLIEALAELASHPWQCVCVGSLDRDPEFSLRVRALVAKHGLQGRVRLTGELAGRELLHWYRTASLFVLPSHYEGYGMALTEALQHGLPVVSTTGGAIPHTVPAGTGVLVPPGDSRALAAAIRSLLTDPVGRAACAAEARAHAATLPDWRTQVDAFGRAVLELSGARSEEETS